MWPHYQKVRCVGGWDLSTVSYHSAKFGGYRYCGSADISFLNLSRNHVIKRLRLLLLLLIFYSDCYTLFLTFTLCEFYVPIKDGFLNVSPFSADMNCFCFNTFYSVLTFFIFIRIAIFILILIIIVMIIFVIIVFFHCHCHYYFFILNVFNFYFLVFTILFYLCIYRIFSNLNEWRDRNIVQSWH